MFVFSGTVFSSTSNIQSFYDGSKFGKKIVFVGDSTTDNVAPLYDELKKSTVKGDTLEGAIIVDRGAYGNTLENFIANKAYNDNAIQRVIDDKADLYVLSYGINDIRGGWGSPNSNQETIKQQMKTAIDRILNETDGYILLRTPNTFLTTNDTQLDFLQPISAAQQYSTSLRNIYESFRGYSSRVDVIDIPSLIFGQKALPSHQLMKDILHPNELGYRAIANAIIDRVSGKTHGETLRNKLTSDQSDILIQECRTNYTNSTTQEEKNKWHLMANEIRKVNGQPTE